MLRILISRFRFSSIAWALGWPGEFPRSFESGRSNLPFLWVSLIMGLLPYRLPIHCLDRRSLFGSFFLTSVGSGDLDGWHLCVDCGKIQFPRLDQPPVVSVLLALLCNRWGQPSCLPLRGSGRNDWELFDSHGADTYWRQFLRINWVSVLSNTGWKWLLCWLETLFFLVLCLCMGQFPQVWSGCGRF